MTERIENLLRQTVPDLKDVPLYLVDATVLAIGELNGKRGWYGRGLDLLSKPLLLARDQWEGRGPCFVIDFDHDPDEIYATVIHEAAHALEQPFSLVESDDYLEGEQQTDAASARALAGALLWGSVDDLPKWFAHEETFLRNVVHLQYRASLAGHDVPLDWIVGRREYDLDIFAFQDALADEPRRLLRHSFASIRQTPLPPRFSDLWRATVLQTLNSNLEPTERFMTVCIQQLENKENRAVA